VSGHCEEIIWNWRWRKSQTLLTELIPVSPIAREPMKAELMNKKANTSRKMTKLRGKLNIRKGYIRIVIT
jgi:hypothetical protein